MEQKLLNQDCIYPNTNHHIRSNCAITFIQNFIEKFNEFSRNSNIGGVFSAGQLRNFGIQGKEVLTPERGVMTYLCLNNTNPNTVSFAVTKTFKEMDFPEDYNLNNHDLLLMSSDPFKYNLAGTSFNDVRSFIQNERSAITENNTEISFENVKPLTEDFQAYFQGENNYPYGFLRHDEEKDLLGQPAPHGNPIVGIRWFLGFDPDQEVNKIRFVFFAVLQNGQSMIQKIDDSSDAVILEKSWPPFD